MVKAAKAVKVVKVVKVAEAVRVAKAMEMVIMAMVMVMERIKMAKVMAMVMEMVTEMVMATVMEMVMAMTMRPEDAISFAINLPNQNVLMIFAIKKDVPVFHVVPRTWQWSILRMENFPVLPNCLNLVSIAPIVF